MDGHASVFLQRELFLARIAPNPAALVAMGSSRGGAYTTCRSVNDNHGAQEQSASARAVQAIAADCP
jgi:hypothetical protein